MPDSNEVSRKYNGLLQQIDIFLNQLRPQAGQTQLQFTAIEGLNSDKVLNSEINATLMQIVSYALGKAKLLDEEEVRPTSVTHRKATRFFYEGKPFSIALTKPLNVQAIKQELEIFKDFASSGWNISLPRFVDQKRTLMQLSPDTIDIRVRNEELNSLIASSYRISKHPIGTKTVEHCLLNQYVQNQSGITDDDFTIGVHSNGFAYNGHPNSVIYFIAPPGTATMNTHVGEVARIIGCPLQMLTRQPQLRGVNT